MLFSEYKEKVLTLLAAGLIEESNKTPAFDTVVSHLSFIAEYYTAPSAHVSDPEYHLSQLEESLVTIHETGYTKG